MNWPHTHLMLNHWPIFGTVFGFLLAAWAAWRKHDELKRVALGLLVLVALGTIPVFLTGEPAEEAVEHLSGVSEDLIEEHEEAGVVALICMEVLGGIALAGLVLARGSRRRLNSFVTALLAFSLVVIGVLGWTANLGGHIRHPETRSDFQSDVPAGEHEVDADVAPE